MPTIPDDDFDLLNLSATELDEVISNLRKTLNYIVSYFKKYANHTSDPEILQSIIIEEITKLNIIIMNNTDFRTPYWNNQIYEDSLYAYKPDMIDLFITDRRIIFTKIHIKLDFFKNEYTFEGKFRKDVAVYQSLITHLHISYDTKKFICDYYTDQRLEYSHIHK